MHNLANLNGAVQGINLVGFVGQTRYCAAVGKLAPLALDIKGTARPTAGPWNVGPFAPSVSS
jgi:hypothetical protein